MIMRIVITQGVYSLNFTYFTIQTRAINSIRQKVRYAEDEDNPQLLSFWLMAEQTLFSGSDINADDDARWQLYPLPIKVQDFSGN